MLSFRYQINSCQNSSNVLTKRCRCACYASYQRILSRARMATNAAVSVFSFTSLVWSCYLKKDRRCQFPTAHYLPHIFRCHPLFSHSYDPSRFGILLVINHIQKSSLYCTLLLWSNGNPVSVLHKSIAGRYRPVRVADGPITARCRFINNTS